MLTNCPPSSSRLHKKVCASGLILLRCLCGIALAGLGLETAAASSITLASGTNPVPIDRSGAGQSFTLDLTLTDWLLGTGNQKLGGGITTTGPSGATFANYPNFSYSNGTSPTSAVEEDSTYRYSDSSFTISIPVADGNGQIILWLGSTTNNHTASFTADFSDTVGTDFSTLFGNTISEQWFLNYTSSGAQTMTVTVNAGNNANAGVFAVGVGPVPEPSISALLVLAGAIGVFHSRTCLRRKQEV